MFKAHDYICWGTGLAPLFRVSIYIVCHFCRPVFILCLWVDANMKLLQYSHSKCNRKWSSQYAVHTVICAKLLCIVLFLCAYFRFCGDPLAIYCLFGKDQYVEPGFCISEFKSFGVLYFISPFLCLPVHIDPKKLSTVGISGKDLQAHFREDFTLTA